MDDRYVVVILIQNYRIPMNRSNSKHKYQSSSYGLSITLQLPTKTIVFKVPMPCPAPTLKEMLLIETQKANCKPAYF